MSLTPHSLLDRLRQPSQSAADWERLVELLGPVLLTWAGRLGLQPADAADLVQDVFVVLLQTLPTFTHDGQGSFHGWLRTILLNRWRDRLRRSTAASTDPSQLDARAETVVEDAMAEAEYRRHLAQRTLQVMQRDFAPTTWRACWETKVQGRPPAEVAAELGLSVAAVHAATYRVLRRLRVELDDFLRS